MWQNKPPPLGVPGSRCLELLLPQRCIAVFGHIWAAGFRANQSHDEGTALGGEDTNWRQADDYGEKCDSYQAANRKKENSQRPEEIVRGRANEHVDEDNFVYYVPEPRDKWSNPSNATYAWFGKKQNNLLKAFLDFFFNHQMENTAGIIRCPLNCAFPVSI